MTNPNPCIGSAVLDTATAGSALFRALGGHLSLIPISEPTRPY